jgi:hypothetical protein
MPISICFSPFTGRRLQAQLLVEVAAVDLILLDWTRMGRLYCLAGAIVQAGQYRIVRPLPARGRDNPVPNQGWSPYLMDGHSRWEVFRLIHPEPAPAAAPHLEDIWVQALESRRRFASRPERCAVLQATLGPPDTPLFGSLLEHGHAGSYLEPGQGERSLASIIVPSADVHFTALWRDGADQPDYRVSLPLPGLDRRILPVKDHFLLCRAEKTHADVDDRLRFLADAVRLMGAHVVVRLGLSRSFPAANGQPGRCWLMADGFFSPDDPQA